MGILEKIGVEAVVEGLSSFQSDMGRIDSAIQAVIPTSKLLGGAFDWLGGVISGFVGGAVRVLEYTLGGLLKDAIEAVMSAIRDLIGEIIAAGSEFQTLSIRLTGLNLPENASEINDWSAAMAEASAKTKEQLDWIQSLATATPFDATDIATTYSLARSYGFADEEARRLTEDISSFVAGMGLGSEVIGRVILNFGQMVQRGKITGTEIRDLARGAFLPLDDVLKRVAKSMGITVEALSAQISTKEGVPAQLFIDAFQEMIETEPRFVGAAGRLARAFEPAINNVKDLFRNIGGLNIVAPVLDVLGEHVAKLVDEFVTFNEEGDLIKTQKWLDLQNAAKGVGEALSSLVTDIINIFIPNTSGMADGIIAGLKGISDWLAEHRDDIISWVQSAAAWINNTLIPAFLTLVGWLFSGGGEKTNVLSVLAKAAQDASKWVGQVLVPFIQNNLIPVLTALWPLAVAIGGVLQAAFGGEPNQSLTDWINTVLIPAIQSMTAWINEHQETLGALLRLWLIGSAALIAFSAAMSLIASVVAEVISAYLGGALIGFGLIIYGLQNVKDRINQFVSDTISAISGWASQSLSRFTSWVSNVYNSIRSGLLNMNWYSIGASIVTGMISGIYGMIGSLVGAAVRAATSAYSAAKSALGIRSPSQLFMELGNFTMEGMAQGIEASAGLATAAMAKAVGQMAMPAMAVPAMVSAAAGAQTSNSYSTTNNFSQTINTSANSEPIASDFQMMASLAGI